MIGSFVTALVFIVLAIAQQAGFENQQRIIRLTSNGNLPELTLPRKFTYHLYLCHSWATGHYPAAYIQKEIGALIPGCRAFHPDLIEHALESTMPPEKYVAQSLCGLSSYPMGFGAAPTACGRSRRQ
jgi:hypothetical protein